MNLLQIAQKMEELAIGNKYLADCCGVTDHYMAQCLKGSKPMTKALERKIEGVFKSIEITPKSILKKEEEKERKVPTLEELADWYKQPHKEETPVNKYERKIEYQTAEMPLSTIGVTKKEKKDIATQIKELCVNYEQMFGEGFMEQKFIFNHKKIRISIDISSEDE